MTRHRGQDSSSPRVHFKDHVRNKISFFSHTFVLLVVTGLGSLAAPGTEGLCGSLCLRPPLGQTT